MLKTILKMKNVDVLTSTQLSSISGGANEYYCWDGNGNTFSSTTDVSSSSVHCAIVSEVVHDPYLYPSDGVRP